jgi:hypothetical protein
MRKPVMIGVLFLLVVMGYVVYSTMSPSPYRVEVCLVFNGSTNCKIASGATEEFAMRAAITNACGEIASGVTDTIACQNTLPKSVTWLVRGK